jgi:hypothetical protein
MQRSWVPTTTRHIGGCLEDSWLAGEQALVPSHSPLGPAMALGITGQRFRQGRPKVPRAAVVLRRLPVGRGRKQKPLAVDFEGGALEARINCSAKF